MLKLNINIGCVPPTSSQEPKESTDKDRIRIGSYILSWRDMIFSYRSRVLAIERKIYIRVTRRW